MVQFHHEAIKRKRRKEEISTKVVKTIWTGASMKRRSYIDPQILHLFRTVHILKNVSWWPLPWTPAFTFLNDRTSHSLCKNFEQNLAERRIQPNGHCLISQTDSNRPEKKQPSWGAHCPPTLQRDTDAQFCTPPTRKKHPVCMAVTSGMRHKALFLARKSNFMPVATYKVFR